MNSKKIFSIILSVCLLVSLLSGCGSSNKDTAGKEKNNEKVTINYAFWNKDQEPFMQEIVDAFEKTHPNIKVNIEVTPYKQYLTKLETSATGGTAPDVFWMNGPNFVKYARGKVLMPLNDRVKKDNYDLNNYSSALIDLYTVDDNLYAVPKDWDTIGLWYNKEMFDEAGISYPDESWDWNKLRETAKKLTNKDNGVWGIAASCTDQQGFYNTIFQSGGFVLSKDKTVSGYDKPETIKGIQCWIDLLNDGSSPSLQQMTDTKPEDLFASGKVAMIYAGSWMGTKFTNSEIIKGKVNVASLPKMDKQGNVIHGLGNVIYAKTKHPEEAWEFVKFLGGKEANEIQAKSGLIIPAHKSALPIYLDAHKELNLKIFADAAEYATMYPCSSDTMKWLQVQRNYMKKAWAGQMSAEEACKETAKKMNEILKNEKK